MLKTIKLENFRNHKKWECELGQITAIVGPNGAGKTNILEAIVILSFCRSFRNDDKKSLISKGSEFARIVGDDLEVFMALEPRFMLKVKERGVPRKIADFIGLLPAVVFSPETMSIITGSPGDRRRFLDIMISQVDKEYLENLIYFKKIRLQRNHLLQKINRNEANEAELDFWDNELAKMGEEIVKKRKEVIEYFNIGLSNFYSEISGNKNDELKIVYQTNFEGDLLPQLKKGRVRELAYGNTIFGPHRDDLVINLNSADMSNFASRGEIRSAILALKVAELKFIEKHSQNEIGEGRNTSPIILLDDVFSEFDPNRRSHLSRLVLQYQTLITATEKEHLSSELLDKAKVIELI